MVRFVFLGDLLISEYNTPYLSSELRALLRSADFACVNFEAPVAAPDHIPFLKTGPPLKQSFSSLQFCKDWGISHLSLANNHIMDYGREGLINTIKQADSLSCFGAGINVNQVYEASFVEKYGVKIALLSFAEAQFGALLDEFASDQAGYAWIDHPRARQAVRDARLNADWVIVQVHAGLEMIDLPLPEWRMRFRELIDLGADLVIGHHPHVIQGSECYRGKMIYYSLGNFYMHDALCHGQLGSGAVLVVNVGVDTVNSELIPLCISSSEIGCDTDGTGMAQYRRSCVMLDDNTEYYTEINKVCDTFWQQVYANYYESALLGLGTRPSFRTAYQLLRRLAGRIVYGRRISSANELLLIHNIRIESHRWAVERALQNVIGLSA